jgi:hypothetical protein
MDTLLWSVIAVFAIAVVTLFAYILFTDSGERPPERPEWSTTTAKKGGGVGIFVWLIAALGGLTLLYITTGYTIVPFLRR